MKSSNRALLYFGVAILILVIATVTLVLTISGRESAPLSPEDTAEGVVQRFLLALRDNDYGKAYDYLALVDSSGKMVSFETWIRDIPRFPDELTEWKATIEKTILREDDATIEVSIDVFRAGSALLRDPVYTESVSFHLNKKGDYWRIISPPYLWWMHR